MNNPFTLEELATIEACLDEVISDRATYLRKHAEGDEEEEIEAYIDQLATLSEKVAAMQRGQS